MAFTKLQELLAQRAVVDAKIRAQRVITIRQIAATKEIRKTSFMDLVTEMERRLAAVHYNHEDFDDLLTQIEEMV